MRQMYLMTMELNGIDPFYHGLVSLDDKDFLLHGEIVGDYDGTPVEDFGCFYMSETNFPSDRDWMFKKFLSFMDDKLINRKNK